MTTASFGRVQGPLVFGRIFVAHQIGGAAAAYGAGFTRTIEGTYTPAFFVSGVFCVVAGILCLFIGGGRNTKKNGLTAPHAATPVSA